MFGDAVNIVEGGWLLERPRNSLDFALSLSDCCYGLSLVLDGAGAGGCDSANALHATSTANAIHAPLTDYFSFGFAFLALRFFFRFDFGR
jgi:hypothetical protein